jgi:hypothetical protein
MATLATYSYLRPPGLTPADGRLTRQTLPAGLLGEISTHGTTNADVNPPKRQAPASAVAA